MRRKINITKILSLAFVLTISLAVGACGGKSTIGNLLSDTTQPQGVTPNTTKPEDNVQSDSNGITDFETISTDNNAEQIALAIAHDGGREYALRLTLPNLQENIASGYYSDVDIWFNEGSISINLQEDEHNRVFISTQYSVVHFEDNDILLSFVMPPDKPMAWGANDTFTIELAGGRERTVFGKYEFHAVDITKPIEQLLPIAKLSELVIDPPSINLKAKNNGDGTMSFIYTDTSIKPDYIIPWDWIEKDGDFLLFADWQITGHYARDPNAVAIGAKFTFATLYDDDTISFGLIRSYYSPPLGVAWEDFNRWESINWF